MSVIILCSPELVRRSGLPHGKIRQLVATVFMSLRANVVVKPVRPALRGHIHQWLLERKGKFPAEWEKSWTWYLGARKAAIDKRELELVCLRQMLSTWAIFTVLFPASAIGTNNIDSVLIILYLLTLRVNAICTTSSRPVCGKITQTFSRY